MMAPPSYIFIVRHGARLDAADKQWHLTSPTPYDSPLTYGGWQQSKALGARIAQTLISSPTLPPRTTRPYKIVIHSSPFHRCIQTSIAIAAGITQPLAPPAPVGFATILPVRLDPCKKSLVRLDSFLGEWMNPDYYERITPPPSSNLMLASAKAELLRKENYDFLTHFTIPAAQIHSQRRSSGALWLGGVSGFSTSAPSNKNGGLENLSSIDDALPAPPPGALSSPGGYNSPSLTFAVAPSCPIPDGFVAHARDTCVVSDYQWDSSREPLDWGDGGEYGEEWQAMHKRFRRGLQRLIDWYSSTETASCPVTVTEGENHPKHNRGVEDSDFETVVVLVTHGAGCNAMIGAITGKPVLLDIPISALTVAKLNPPADLPAGIATGTVAVDQTYDIVTLVDTGHYRTPSESARASSTRASPIPLPSFRNRGSSMSAYSRPVIIRPFSYSDGASTQGPYDVSSQLSSQDLSGSDHLHLSPVELPSSGVRLEYLSKTVATAIPAIPIGGASRAELSRSGLWAPIKSKLLDLEEDDDMYNMFPDYEQKRLGTSPGSMVIPPMISNSEPGSLLPAIEIREVLSGGPEEAISDLPLTGAPSPPGGLWEGVPRADTKRRWTLNES